MKFGYRVLFALSLTWALCGCMTEHPRDVPEGVAEANFGKNSYGQFELSNEDFRMTFVKTGDEAFRIVSITNLRADVTSVDLRRFGNGIFHYILASKLDRGETITAEDEDVLYFSLDIWVGTMNDITTYVGMRMRSDAGYVGIPDDFEKAALFLDLKKTGASDNKRFMSAVPREDLRRLRSLCAKNLGNCDTGRLIDEFGKDFWDIPLEAFLYQLATVREELKYHKEERYLKPNFGNLWGLLRTNDKRLAAYAVKEDVVKDRRATDEELSQTFAEMDVMVDQVHKALSAAGDAKSRDILRDVYEEFGRKDAELKGNLDLVLVDVPVAIYAKIALNEIDQAKGIFDSEEDMVLALERYRARTENGLLVKRAKSKSARNLDAQLLEKARDELGDKVVMDILGRL